MHGCCLTSRAAVIPHQDDNNKDNEISVKGLPAHPNQVYGRRDSRAKVTASHFAFPLKGTGDA